MTNDRVIRALCEEMAEVKNLVKLLSPAVKTLTEIYQLMLTREIQDDQYLLRWDDFDCRNGSLILSNAVSIDRPGLVRVHTAFGFPVTIAYYLNNQGAYLNSKQPLTTDCGYVFDIPLNPGDALNFTVAFDDSESVTARCKFFRLQVVY